MMNQHYNLKSLIDHGVNSGVYGINLWIISHHPETFADEMEICRMCSNM